MIGMLGFGCGVSQGHWLLSGACEAVGGRWLRGQCGTFLVWDLVVFSRLFISLVSCINHVAFQVKFVLSLYL